MAPAILHDGDLLVPSEQVVSTHPSGIIKVGINGWGRIGELYLHQQYPKLLV